MVKFQQKYYVNDKVISYCVSHTCDGKNWYGTFMQSCARMYVYAEKGKIVIC